MQLALLPMCELNVRNLNSHCLAINQSNMQRNQIHRYMGVELTTTVSILNLQKYQHFLGVLHPFLNQNLNALELEELNNKKISISFFMQVNKYINAGLHAI